MGEILSLDTLIDGAGLGFLSPPPALHLKGSVPDPTAKPSSETGGLGITHSQPGLDARLEIINAINIHNKQPSEMMRAIVCSPLGLSPKDGNQALGHLCPSTSWPGEVDPCRGARCQAGFMSPSQPCQLPANPHTCLRGGWG